MENPYRSPQPAVEVDATVPAPASAGWPPPFWLRLALYAAVILLIFALLLPASRTAREPARRNACTNNLRQIALALHSYHDLHGAFPPAYTADAEGNKLHSWRTLLLPYLDEQELFESIDLTKPWDDPANATARERIADVLVCPSSPNEEQYTTYFAVTGDGAAFPGADAVSFSDVTDGAARTIAVVDLPGVDTQVHWMEPRDISAHELTELIGSQPSLSHPGIMQAAFLDAHVRAIPLEVDHETLRALLTVAGGESLDEDDF